MIESVSQRGQVPPDRVTGSGLGLAVAERLGASASPVEARPLSPAAAQASPFDRKDLVEIRGNVRPLSEDARVGLGASDEEGGGAPEGGAEERPGVLQRRALAAYDPFARAQAPAAPLVQAQAAVREAPIPDRRARQLAEAFKAREPEAALGRILDLAA